MNISDRLEQWAGKIKEYGPDLSRWASSSFIVETMRMMATRFREQEQRIAELEAKNILLRKSTVQLEAENILLRKSTVQI